MLQKRINFRQKRCYSALFVLFANSHIRQITHLLVQWSYQNTRRIFYEFTQTHYRRSTGLKYELIGDYYLIAGDDEEPKDNRPIGKWGQLHLNHLKKHCKSTYYSYLMNGTLHDYLCGINDQAEEMFNRIVSQMAEADGTDENLKAIDQMKWVGLMNNYRHCTEEVVFDSIIYT